jgi:glycosyltransferase involved in cell wall biosynthesis
VFEGKKISLVIPAYNEERLIRPTLKNAPPTVDKVFVIDDASTDNMAEVVKGCMKEDKRIELIRHEKNQGVGQGIITGYKRSAEEGYDIAVVIGGDNQMDLKDLPNFLEPLVKGEADYTKGNRFMKEGNAFEDMPRIRLLGNTILSLMTKIASGYYKLFDVVDGYTAITRDAIKRVNWDKAWKGYGYVIDFLIRLNAYSLKAKDVPRRAIYISGERQSQIRVWSYIIRVSPLIIRGFFWRLWKKYVLSDFHPLVFLYFGGLITLPAGLVVGARIINAVAAGGHPSGATSIFCALLITIGIQSLFFAMLFDMMESS